MIKCPLNVTPDVYVTRRYSYSTQAAECPSISISIKDIKDIVLRSHRHFLKRCKTGGIDSNVRSKTYLEEVGVNGVVGIPGRTVGILNGDTRAAVVPVAATDNNGLTSDIAAGEAEVVAVERAVNIHDLAEVLDDVAVIADLVVGAVP